MSTKQGEILARQIKMKQANQTKVVTSKRVGKASEMLCKDLMSI